MSRRLLGAAALTAAILALPSGPAYGQKKAPAKAPAAAVDAGKLPAGEFIGELKAAPGSDRTFMLEYQMDRLVPTGKGGGNNGGRNNNNGQIAKAMQHMQRAQAHVASARNPQERQRAMQDASRAQQEYDRAVAQAVRAAAGAAGKGGAPAGFRVEKTRQLVEFQAAEAVKVRTLFTGEEFDDKGNPKTLTKDDALKLKGKDRNLPGYESSLEKLEVGQKVRVVLAAAPRKAGAGLKDAEKDGDDAKAEKRMQVKLIVVVEESKGTPAAKGKGKAKK